ncbi:hypothetical protein ASPACDRAFT_121650 [Aspergillus aculeatus ATCC 16872]|uniref:Uncharacterized protein n=1 Tax=Aspergillus aculeatus (strain ATCC 16872 / CBS 172.66 / WB 5094) TaxID=690307 RepID=A0A1L9WS36_ASPA1|nr:uncharacterized protein ASPACDRAFT_121650 [Aspergillus aculeatus ATCC 16872]OJJ98888.1 hypothetical protein ASPACDRAFT_121650 [Aspergillus aculeatus ATCC 16872]
MAHTSFAAAAAVVLLLSSSPFTSIVGALQPSAPDPVAAPLRDLEWGQLNFLHTTDTHGWLAGHLQEPSYAADWGDYISFAARMRDKAESDGSDLLVIDTGDRVEGNGLYDSSEPKGVYLSEILREQHIDLLSSGNHELYNRTTSQAEFFTTIPNFRGSYLASNVDILHPAINEFVPLAPRFKKFTTQNQGIRIIAFGFLDQDVDLFLVLGHVPVRSVEYDAVYREIRAIRWDTPIQFFGGHYHIRDYVRYDSKAYGLASGRFMETIGFMSIDGLSTSKHHIKPAMAAPKFSRKYIDNNLFSFYHHTDLDEGTFHTEHGRNVSLLIQQSRSALKLDKIHGCAPRDLWMSRVKYPHENSIYTWLEEEVLSVSLKDESRSGKPALAIVNTGAIRFDIFRGPFTQDTTYIVSPFSSGFRYVKDVPYHKAKFVVEVLNKQPQIMTEQRQHVGLPTWSLAPPEQSAHAGDTAANRGESLRPAWYASGSLTDQALLSMKDYAGPNLIPGYTTTDDAGTDGDDTVHSPLTFYRVPNCIQSLVSPTASDPPETVDLVYIDFIEPYVALAAKFASLDVDFTRDSDVYMPSTSLTSLILNWVKTNWGCEDGSL